MRGFVCVGGLALGSLGGLACGSVVSRPTDDASTDGKNGIIIDDIDGGVVPADAVSDGPVGHPVDAGPPPPPLCAPPTSTPAANYQINLFDDAAGHTGTDKSCPTVGTSFTRSNPQYISCRRRGGEVRDSAGNYNHWWLWTELDQPTGKIAWISAYYIKDQGNDQADDIRTGRPIPDCP